MEFRKAHIGVAMDSGQSNHTPNSTRESEPLDVQPLRTLAPMFPSSYGVNTFSVPGGAPFIYVTPSGPNFPSPTAPTHLPPFATPQQASTMRPRVGQPPASANGAPQSVNSNGSVRHTTYATPLATVIPVDDDSEPITGGHTTASGRQTKQPMHSSSHKIRKSGTGSSAGSKAKPSKKRLQRIRNNDFALVPSCQDPRESVEIVLMTFDALRRRLLQQDESKEGKDGNRRPDLKAGTVLMTNDLRANMGKRIGAVPGVEIGDIFYFRMELCLVGLHAPSMGGIDYMTSTFENGDDTVAISVVSAGGYENEEGDVDELIYSGQGGNTNVDQKLERGNLALERSLHRSIDIRVIRSAKDYTCPTGKIYIYDGLYKVQESWVEKGKTGFNVFKYKLLRKPDQPVGIATWKKIQNGKTIQGLEAE
ncbi:histone-lysine N-methyltransferase, H3 lysine-9 specific SUVH3-like [Iris pallida]|uniref:Histone-lysine N-methyltransferase, H3 lysine-9 specific SUVH3-like n=1 Tax=Iris pallida TaxID=29817 RepID=A0AAX6DSR4_IRIPA|nr:histone-lysine N-methyltransferase, H3 lysine-9 specific SUVH3-like [Iris pallida]